MFRFSLIVLSMFVVVAIAAPPTGGGPRSSAPTPVPAPAALEDPPELVEQYQWIVKERYCYLILKDRDGSRQVGAYDRRYNYYLQYLGKDSFGQPRWSHETSLPPVGFPPGIK